MMFKHLNKNEFSETFENELIDEDFSEIAITEKLKN